MRIAHARIKNYGCLKDVTFEGQPLLVFIGPNGQGKSLIFEALYRFFAEFSPFGGSATNPVSDILWYWRETEDPIEFELTLELDETEIRQVLPFEDKLFSLIKGQVLGDIGKLILKRSLSIQGTWKTLEIKWGKIPLVVDDTLITAEKFTEALSPKEHFKAYKMYFFTEGYSAEKIGGDRVLLITKRKKGFTSHPIIDELVKKGFIESSVEFIGKNMQEWAKEKGYEILPPTSADLADLQIITLENLQKASNSLAKLKEFFKLFPAARDVKSPLLQRGSLLEPSLLQTITSTSIDRKRVAEKKWEKFRSFVEPLLVKRLEPNPSQVLVKQGDLGLLPGQIGGGEQSVLGLIWDTMDKTFIFAIEEPEIHLHPGLQRKMLDYFMQLTEKTQVLLTTHSQIFASRPDITSVYIVAQNEDGATQVDQVNEVNIGRIIDELGIKASDIFDFDVVTLVEGIDDVRILNVLARRFADKSKPTVGFVDSEGWNSMAYYANARLFTSRKVKVDVFAIFDGDTEKEEKNKKIKERLIKTLNLKEGHIITLKKNSIEDYLLKPDAIKRAFPQIQLSLDEISELLKTTQQKKNKKEVLDIILKKGGIGSYNGEFGALIMRSMNDEEIDEELKEIIQTLGSKEGKKAANASSHA